MCWAQHIREARASSSRRSRFLSPKTTRTQRVWNQLRVSLNSWARKRAHLLSPRGSGSTKKLQQKRMRSGDKTMHEWWTSRKPNWKSWSTKTLIFWTQIRQTLKRLFQEELDLALKEVWLKNLFPNLKYHVSSETKTLQKRKPWTECRQRANQVEEDQSKLKLLKMLKPLLKDQRVRVIKELSQVLNHIDLKSRNTLKSGISEIPGMLQKKHQVKWDYYVVKEQDQKDLQSQQHLNFKLFIKQQMNKGKP